MKTLADFDVMRYLTDPRDCAYDLHLICCMIKNLEHLYKLLRYDIDFGPKEVVAAWAARIPQTACDVMATLVALTYANADKQTARYLASNAKWAASRPDAWDAEAAAEMGLATTIPPLELDLLATELRRFVVRYQ